MKFVEWKGGLESKISFPPLIVFLMYICFVVDARSACRAALY